MQLYGREFSGETIAQIGEILSVNPCLSRRALSLRVCDLLQWTAPNGKFKEVSCRKALLELHRRGFLNLPAASESCFNRSSSKPPPDLMADVPELECALDELGTISIAPVSSRYSKASKIWNTLSDSIIWAKGHCAGHRFAA